ncbi:MAG: pyridoxamine 5'-phosphate oxidase family protein [Clostridiales bacterium]|nr:pyridoxamine 5'-phosphate oxidase family protein [Clostridiales bacterium]
MFREMRRKDRLATEETGVALLNECVFGVLSVLGDDGYPYGVPVNFAYRDNCVFVHCFLEGHKIDAVKNHSKVCLTAVGGEEVMKGQISTNYTSVVAFGRAEVVPPPENDVRETAFAAIMDKYVPNEQVRTAAYTKAHEGNAAVIIVHIEHMTCKKRDIR